MTEQEIDILIESIRNDAEHDIEDFKRIYEALVSLRGQRDAIAATLRDRLALDEDLRFIERTHS